MKQKILIIRFSSIGDIVLTTPVVRQLRTRLEDAEIHFLTKQKHRCLLEANPYIDKIYSFEKKLEEIIPSLKAEKYDYVIDLHHNLRSLKVKWHLRSKSFSFKKLNFEKWMLVTFKVDQLPNIHIVERYLDTIKSFGIKDDGKGLDYFIPENEKFDIGELPERFQKGYVAVILAGTYFTKRLPAAKYLPLVSNTQYNFVLLGGEKEMEMAQSIMTVADGNVIDFCGKLNINQSASLVEQARLVISNDTGLMHIAAAFRKKIVSVWGNTVPQLGMYPYLPGEGSKMLEVGGLKCRPCSKLGKHKCPKKHFNCMNLIPEQALINWVKNNF
ncbi:MAG TPA: glycosyl transferase [Prolixibacteraceae bacterium]|nr:glycosyl transferase [Prolixibacteraceae bacterium]